MCQSHTALRISYPPPPLVVKLLLLETRTVDGGWCPGAKDFKRTLGEGSSGRGGSPRLQKKLGQKSDISRVLGSVLEFGEAWAWAWVEGRPNRE